MSSGSVYDLDLDHHPGPNCPPFCVMGVDGFCAGEFQPPPDGFTPAEGDHVYARRLADQDGNQAVEVAVAQEHGGWLRIMVTV